MDKGALRIVIAQRGFVFVGWHKREDFEIVIRDPYFIHRWGTKQGLGQLTSGPTSSTVLHKSGTIRLHPLQVLAVIDVEEKGWASHFEVGK